MQSSNGKFRKIFLHPTGIEPVISHLRYGYRRAHNFKKACILFFLMVEAVRFAKLLWLVTAFLQVGSQ